MRKRRKERGRGEERKGAEWLAFRGREQKTRERERFEERREKKKKRGRGEDIKREDWLRLEERAENSKDKSALKKRERREGKRRGKKENKRGSVWGKRGGRGRNKSALRNLGGREKKSTFFRKEMNRREEERRPLEDQKDIRRRVSIHYLGFSYFNLCPIAQHLCHTDMYVYVLKHACQFVYFQSNNMKEWH